MPRRKGGTKQCTSCKAPYYVPFYRISSTKFCSRQCQNKKQWEHKNKHTLCVGCKTEFEYSPSRHGKKRFCSMTCRSAVALTMKERRARQRASRIKRRGFTTGRTIKKNLSHIRRLYCDACGYDEFEFCLDVHHKNENPLDNRFENIALLCAICHRKVHKKVITLTEGNLCHLKKEHQKKSSVKTSPN